MKYTKENLIIHPNTSYDPDLIIEVTPQTAGWQNIHFQSRRLAKGGSYFFAPGACESALVVLSGSLSAKTNRGNFANVGKRQTVFHGLPEALYLPRDTEATISAESDCEYAMAWVPASREYPIRRINQSDICTEIRGGDNVTRQINDIIPPGFACEHLVVVEVYTPSGNWSSYPPHKHDGRRLDEKGNLLEADLEEIYYYKLNHPNGFALQRLYTDETSPLQQKGNPIDEVLLLQDNDLVLVPEGYHPVVSAPGYITYYLNVLSGSDQTLTAYDDPRYSWVKQSYRGLDERIPIYPINKGINK